jgi:3-phenylpropionate/trans-cinnamate dioxygenase ferredoxin subunit
MAEYTSVGKVEEFPEGEIKARRLNDEPVAIVNSQGNWYAFSNECTHTGAALSMGYVDNNVVICWLHNSVFDMNTGEKLEGPAFEPLTIYDIKIDGDDVLIGKR